MEEPSEMEEKSRFEEKARVTKNRRNMAFHHNCWFKHFTWLISPKGDLTKVFHVISLGKTKKDLKMTPGDSGGNLGMNMRIFWLHLMGIMN